MAAATFQRYDVITQTVAVALATSGTLAFTYPTTSPARAAQNYSAASGATLIAAQGFEGVFTQGASNFSLSYGATTVTVTYLGTTTIPVGTVLTLQIPLIDYNSDYTDSSTGALVRTIAAGAGSTTLSFPVDLTSFTTGALDLVTTYLPGYKFKILDMQYVANKVATGAGATQTFTPKITGVAVTGGVVNPTLANAAVMGVKVAGTSVTGANTGSATDTISISASAGGVVFTAGSGVMLLKVQNMDVADAVASITDSVNKINAILRAREIYPQQVSY